MERRAWARREEAVEQILSDEGLVDQASTDLDQIVSGADLLILAMPTGSMGATVSKMSSWEDGKGALITDVGSVKAAVEKELKPLAAAKGARFLGSHPMAGSEKTGIEHAEADLFEGAAVILTPASDSELKDLVGLEAFWAFLGGRTSVLAPKQHDETVAAISHLPHLVASALIRSVLDRDASLAEYSGGGFRDTTRVAAGPADMWTGILLDNHEALSGQLGSLIHELESWKAAIDSLDRDQLRRFLSRSQELRSSI